MANQESQVVKLAAVEGFFHDPEWYRPLIFGTNLYMNVTYVLPGISMVMGSKKEREAEKLERILFVLSGTLQVTHGEEQFTLSREMALLIPLEGETAYEVRNIGKEPARFLSVFSPPPHPELKIESRDQLRRLYEEKGRIVRSSADMKKVIGSLAREEEV